MDIPLITERKYLKGTPKVCLDCSELCVDYHSWPVPGYKYCEVCLVGKILDATIRKLTWWQKLWTEPMWVANQDFFSKLELRANPVEDKKPNVSSFPAQKFYWGNVGCEIMRYPHSLNNAIRLTSCCGYNEYIDLSDAELKSYDNIRNIPMVEKALRRLKERELMVTLAGIEHYDAVRVSTLGSEKDYWIPVRK